jgi:hypothetical protein
MYQDRLRQQLISRALLTIGEVRRSTNQVLTASTANNEQQVRRAQRSCFMG